MRRVIVVAAVLAMALTDVASAQARVEFRLGIGGTPVSDAWNPLSVVVRDAPGAVLQLTIDAGGLDLGEVPQRLEALVAPAGGVQRLDVDVPLPSWRRITWRVEQDGRVLASGAMGARDRDPRRLDLLLSSRPAEWIERLEPDARPIVVAASELPRRAAGWDGVGRLIVDGTAAPPTPEAVVSAAAAGVIVYLPSDGPAGYDELGRLVRDGPVAIAAGRLEPLPSDDRLASLAGASTLQRLLPAALARAVPPPAWDHRSTWTIGLLGLGFALLAFSLLRYGGAAGAASAAMLMVAALLAAPFAAPPEVQPAREDAVVVVAGGIGLRYEHRSIASLPAGETPLDGVLSPTAVRSIAWRDGRTVVDLAAGEHVAFDVGPRIVNVPDDVQAASQGIDPAAPAALVELVPVGAALLRSAEAWWLVLDPGGAS